MPKIRLLLLLLISGNWIFILLFDSFSHDAELNELIRGNSREKATGRQKTKLEQCGVGSRVVQGDSWPEHPSLAPSRTCGVVCRWL